MKPFDAVVIGSGAGGGASAYALTRQGYRVLVLEAGPVFAPEQDYQVGTSRWQQGFPHKAGSQGQYSYVLNQRLSENWSHIRSWNHITGRLNPGDERIAFAYHHVRGVGGSSLHFTGEAHRLNPKSMHMFSQFGVAADWPISYETLEPYYVQAENIVGIAGPANNDHRPRSAPYPYAAHAMGYTTQLLQKGFTRVKMKLEPNSLAVLPQARPQRMNCNYCNSCLKGCPRKDKGSIDVTYLQSAKQTGLCEIRSGCVVTRILTDHTSGTVSGLEYIANGKKYKVKTPLLVIAAGAIETPRLLLLSATADSPNGLCNESGQVGRNFMETLLWTSNALYHQPVQSYRGLPVDSICWDFNAPDAIPGVVGGCRFSPSVAESDLLGPVAYATRVVKGWGRQHKQGMRRRFGQVISLSGICESLPHAKSFVALDPVTKDRHGLPIASIHSYVDDMAAKRIAFMAKKCREILKAAGATEIFEEFSSYDIFSSSHVFGTCRMGNDPQQSVVDANCRSHRWRNLYILDASVFPSSGGGESPGLTIQALALRAMDRIEIRQVKAA
jgi:choline dehydrogenase-like flavoprotein